MRAVRAVLAARLDRVLPFFPGLDDFVLFLWLAVAELLAFVEELPACVELVAAVWAAIGDTAISAAKTPARQRVERGTESGEVTTLILPL
jgi:hypothetical protein